MLTTKDFVVESLLTTFDWLFFFNGTITLKLVIRTMYRSGYVPKWVCTEVGMYRSGYVPKWVCTEVGPSVHT
jgi:hypothetical protein